MVAQLKEEGQKVQQNDLSVGNDRMRGFEVTLVELGKIESWLGLTRRELCDLMELRH